MNFRRVVRYGENMYDGVPGWLVVVSMHSCSSIITEVEPLLHIARSRHLDNLSANHCSSKFEDVYIKD